MEEAAIRFIGRVETPYRTLSECPRNVDPNGPVCTIQIDPEYAAGLVGLEAGQHVWVLYWLHDADREALVRRRRDDGAERGVFALRSPHRPNPIGAAAVRIDAIRETSLEVRGLDCLDGTPLLDIRPAMFAEQADIDGPFVDYKLFRKVEKLQQMFAERDGDGRWAVVG